MRITLIITGSTKVSHIEEGTNEYIKRIGHYTPFSTIITRDVKTNKNSTPAKIRKEEGKRILQHIKPGDYLILLDERGKQYTSDNFASKLNSLQARTKHVVFVIGGAYGFSEEIYSRGDERISLSDMTFSHQMVRMIFTEQLYRAFTILKGEPYHHN